MSKHEQPLRKNFLELFVNLLIKNSYTPTREDLKPEPIIDQNPQKIRLNHPLVRITSTKPVADLLPPLPPPMPIQPPPLRTQQGIKRETIKLGKITPMLVDPTVSSVECPGPGKNIQVNKSGKVQPTGLSMTKEEIKALMEEVSAKTRIPITTGLFKAAIQDLLVTAVMSDFVGTRFIIQKRAPYQNQLR